MSTLGVEGLRAERDATLTIMKSLSDDEWNAPSDCEGWAVRDVIAHMASVLHGVADPSKMADMSGGTEIVSSGGVASARRSEMWNGCPFRVACMTSLISSACSFM